MPNAFPAELLATQRQWYVIYYRLAAGGPESQRQTAILRRQLLRLSVRIAAHPYWESDPSPAARMALKQTALATLRTSRGRQAAPR